MKLRTTFFGAATVCAIALVGCQPQASADKSASSSTAEAKSTSTAAAKGSAASSSSAAAAADSGPKGLAAKDNDAKIVALAKAVMNCPWEDSGFKYDCEDHKKWSDASDDFKDGAGDKTLVNMLEDPEEKVRWLAAGKLSSWGSVYKTDKDLAARVIAVAEKEKATKLAYSLGHLLGEINYEKTGLWDRTAAIVHKHDLAELRRTVVSSMVYPNKENDAVIKLAMEMVKDSDKDMQRASINAFSSFSGSKVADGCKFLLEQVDNPEDAVAGNAARTLSTNSHCGDQIDGLIAAIDKHVKDKKTNENSDWAYALDYACGNDKSTDKQKAAAEDIAKTLASADTKGNSLRYGALDALIKCDPKGGKTEVQKYTSDKEDYVRRHAKDLLNPEKK